MKRTLVTIATVLFGIVPATLLLLSNALFLLSVSAGPQEGITLVVDWLHVTLLLLLTVAALVGYTALFFAARLRMSGKVVGCLLVGVAVVVYELLSTQHEALIVGALLLPVTVALAHSISFLAQGRASALTK